MTETQQPDALQIAEALEGEWTTVNDMLQAASKLRCLHARVQELEAQQERKPLSDEQIDDLAAHHGLDEFIYMPFARDLEAEHGITQETRG